MWTLQRLHLYSVVNEEAENLSTVSRFFGLTPPSHRLVQSEGH